MIIIVILIRAPTPDVVRGAHLGGGASWNAAELHTKIYMRNLLGWLGTRLAQNTLNYNNIA